MKITAALLKEQGVSFAVVNMKSWVLNPLERDSTATSFRAYFPGFNIILMS
jgi:hypothetical protein